MWPVSMNQLPLAHLQILETMGRLAYFQEWPQETRDRLASGAKLFALPKNNVLVHKGDSLDSLYVVVSGRVRLFIPLPNNMERVIALVGKGESFGESCLVLSEPCPFQAIAGQDSHLLAINAMVYRREIRARPELGMHVLERVARRFLDTMHDMEICAQPSSVMRVVGYLMQHQPPHEQSFAINLPGRKCDIAGKLGITQETFSRVLSFLGKQGLILMNGGQIHVADGAKLAQLNTAALPKKTIQ